MKKITLLLILYLFFHCTILNAEDAINFTQEELDYIKNNSIQMCVDPDWLPYEKLNKNNEHIGIIADYYKIFTKLLGREIELIPTKTWKQTLEYAKSRKCDIISTAAITEKRKEYLAFTAPYLKTPIVIATKSKEIFIRDLKSILNKTFTAVKDYSHVKLLRKQFPAIKIKEVKNVASGLREVSTGKAFGFIGAIPSIAYEIQNNNLFDLKISGTTGYSFDLSIAVRNDHLILLSIFQKAINSISKQKHKEISDKWIPINYVQGFDYSLFWKIIAGISVIVLLILFWNRKLMIEVKERVKAEELLKKFQTDLEDEKERLFVTIRSIGDAVITTDTAGRINIMNKVAEDMTGWTFDDAAGRQLEDVFPIINSITRKKLKNPVSHVIASGQIVGIANHTILISKNGTEYQIADSAAPIQDSEGNITGVVLVFRNITEEYAMREKVKESEKQFRTLVEQSPISIQIFNPNGLTINANKAWESLWQSTSSQIIGRYNVLKDKTLHGTKWFSQFKRAFAGEVQFLPDLEYDLQNSNGNVRKRIIKCVAFPIKNKEIVNRVVLMHQDITDQKQAEIELLKMKKMKSIGTLAAGIAHDFNNILMGLFGNISIAKAGLSQKHESIIYLENAEKSMNRATRLTAQLLTFAKGGAPVKKDVRIYKLIKDVVRFDLSGSNVKPIFSAAKDVWLAEVDKGQIQQVFSNLAINAAQAMPSGGHLYISLKNTNISNEHIPELKSGKYIKVSVRDEGCGIDNDYIDQIFDPYFTTKETGSGLGLATIYSILKRHGGYVCVDSELTMGTVFTVYLPASETNKSAIKKQPATAVAAYGKPAHVLVMDDEDIICDVCSQMLTSLGYTVVTASHGKEAIEIYKKAMSTSNKFDVVIMDLTIPGGVGGQEAVKQILSLDPQARAIVSSGYSSGSVISNYAAYGFKGVIEKPYTLATLRKTLNEVLNDIYYHEKK